MLQRISAVYLAGFLCFLLVHFCLHPHPAYAEWRDWFAQPVVSIACAGFVLAILLHAWVGMRDIVLDYIHTLGLRVVILTLICLLLAGCGFWAMRILILASALL